MKKKIFAWILPLMAALLFAAAGAEKAGDTVTGYFKSNKYLRPAMVASADVLDTIPAYTVMTVRVTEGFWGEYTSENGISGYIYFKEMLSVPEWTPCTPYNAWCQERQALRSLPETGQKTERRIEASQLIVVDGTWKGFLHVTLPDGESGYVLKKTVSRAEFSPKPIGSTVAFCVGEASAALEMPLSGAAEVLNVAPGTVYRTEETCGDYYVLRDGEGSPAYVWKGNARVMSASDTAQQNFFSLPKISGAKGRLVPENVYSKGLVKAEGAELVRTEGENMSLPAGESVYVYASYGGFYGVRSRKTFGYIRREELEIPDRATLMEQIRSLDLSGASIPKNEYLDEAMVLLEEGNSFLLRYNAITGSSLEPLFPLGMPYFWGGRNYRAITERWPEYTVREDWQSSGGHYVKGLFYIYGFDCIGLVKHVCAKAGHSLGSSVSALGEDYYCEHGNHVWCSKCRPMPEDWAEVAAGMEIGDVMLIHYPGTHAMIYIGTLRDYGYTAEQLPALADCLDYPLMIQSGTNPYCYFRFKALLDSGEDRHLKGAVPPDGGASVCILGPAREDAEMIIDYLEDTSKACFEVEGTCITAFSFRNVVDYFVYRETPLTDGEQTLPEEGAEGPETETGEEPEEETGADPEAYAEPETDASGESE